MPYQMRNDMQSSPEVSRQDSVIDTFEPHYSLDDTYKTSLFQVVVTLEDEATPDLSPCDTSSARKSPDDPLYQARVLHNVAEQNSWLEKVHEDLFSSTISLGAFVRNSDGTYTSTATDFSALCATSVLGPAAALTFSSQEVTQLLQHTYPDQGEVRISDASSMAVVESIEDIARQDLVFRPGITQALCRSEHIILIWGMSIHEIITEAQGLQTWLRCTSEMYFNHIPVNCDLPAAMSRFTFPTKGQTSSAGPTKYSGTREVQTIRSSSRRPRLRRYNHSGKITLAEALMT